MDNNIIKTKNNNQSGVVKVSHEAASYYADLAKKWAVKTDSQVDCSEYSAKYYADKAKSEAESIAETIESANELINGIETTKTEISQLKETSITNIQEEKSSAISSIEEAKTTAVNAVEETKTQASADLETEKTNAIKEVQGVSNIKIATTEQAGLVKPDGETISIDAEGVLSAILSGSSSGSSGLIKSTNIKFYTAEEGEEYTKQHSNSFVTYSKPKMRGDILFENSLHIRFGRDIVAPTGSNKHCNVCYNYDPTDNDAHFQSYKVMFLTSVEQTWTDILETPTTRYTVTTGQWDKWGISFFAINENTESVILDWIAIGLIREGA